MDDKEWQNVKARWREAWRAYDRATAFGCRQRGESFDPGACARAWQDLNAVFA